MSITVRKRHEATQDGDLPAPYDGAHARLLSALQNGHLDEARARDVDTPDTADEPLAHLAVNGERPAKKTVPGVILDYEILNDDRQDEIIQAARETTDVAADEWIDDGDDGLTVDWDALRDQADGWDREIRYWEERYAQPDELMIWLQVAPHDGMYFEPGDFAAVALPDVDADSSSGDTPRRAYSMANSPQESVDTPVGPKYADVRETFGDGPHPYVNGQTVDLDDIAVENALEFTVKVIPDDDDSGHSLTPRLYRSLTQNPIVQVRGADTHHLSAYDPSEHDTVYVATGTGGAPLHSMLMHRVEQGHDHHDGETQTIWFFHGAATEDVLPYRDELQALAAGNDHIHYIDTLSREAAFRDYTGEDAYVQDCLLAYTDPETVDADALTAEQRTALYTEPEYDVDARVDMTNSELAVCGKRPMVASMDDIVDRVGDVPYQKEVF
jgi:ferredoxin-NADP reductase